MSEVNWSWVLGLRSLELSLVVSVQLTRNQVKDQRPKTKDQFVAIQMGADMFQDLRYGLRILLKKPVFTLIAVLSLALGIGANTAIFSLLDAVMLKSLPVQEPEKLVLFGKGEGMGVTNTFPNESCQLFSYPFYREVQQNNEVFSGVAALLSIPWTVHGSVNTNGSSGEIEKLDARRRPRTPHPSVAHRKCSTRRFGGSCRSHVRLVGAQVGW